MEYDVIRDCYKKKDLDKIIDAAVEKVCPGLGLPEKLVYIYYDTSEWDRGTSDYNDTYQEFTNQTRFYVKKKKVVFVDESNIYVVPFSKITDYSIVLPNEDDQSVYSSATQTYKTDTGDVIKRAIIGGAIAGGVGAIIGGATAKSVKDENKYEACFRALASREYLELHLKFDDILAPVIKIGFDSEKEKIQEVAETLNVIVKRNADKFNENKKEADNEEVLRLKYDLIETGNLIGISPTNPDIFYKSDNKWWDWEGVIEFLVGLAIVLGLLYMCT